MLSRRDTILTGFGAGFTALVPGALSAQEQTEDPMLAAQLAEIDIPWGDAQDNTKRGVQSLAATVSQNSQSIVLYSPTRAVWNAVLDGARRSRHAGKSVVNGMLLATDDKPSIELYANGQLTATILRPDPELLSADIQDGLARDYVRLQSLGLTSEPQAPGLESDG